MKSFKKCFMVPQKECAFSVGYSILCVADESS